MSETRRTNHKTAAVVEKIAKTLNGHTAISLERLFVLFGVPSILGIAGWVLVAVISLQSLGPRVSLLEEGFLLLNADRIANPRHSSRDDANIMSEHLEVMNRRLDEIQRRLQKLEGVPE